MKLVETHDIFSVGMFAKSEEWRIACKQVKEAIHAVDWHPGNGTFTIYPESGKKRGKGNGVDLIKKACNEYLKRSGWLTKKLPPFDKGILFPGNLDALRILKAGLIGFKWAIGDIASSHRTINKLLLAIQTGGLLGVFLIVKSDSFKSFLGDRIWNFGELRPYLPLWSSIPIKEGVLRIEVVEHDAKNPDKPRIGTS
jgi:hypothetical protein